MADGQTPAPPSSRLHRQSSSAALSIAVALGVSCVMAQLSLLREVLGAFSGNELVLGLTLGNWLLLMGIGARLGRTADRWKRPLPVLLVLQIVAAIVPLFQVLLLRGLRNSIFIRGADVGVTETTAAVLVLLLPYCVVAGGALTLACSIAGREQGAAGVGRVYVADAIGSIGGGVLFSLVLVRYCDHLGILVLPALLNLLIAFAIGLRHSQKGLAGLAMALAAAVAAAIGFFDGDKISTGWQFPRQQIVAAENSPYGKLVVTESDGQFDFTENGVPYFSTHDDQHVEETAHYAMVQRPGARRVLLVGGGVSGTAREILKHGVEQVDYVELDPAILHLGRRYAPENLADDRIRVLPADGRQFIRQTGEKYNAVILDVAPPSTLQLNRFFTVEFFGEVKRVLSPGGVMSFALGHYENYLSPELTRLLASAGQSLKPSFRNVLVVPGSRVYFVASDGPLTGDIAAAIEHQGIRTKWMNRHYLDAMLAPDRMAEVRRATAQPAAPNRDFSPVLYYYELRHWLSRFPGGIGVLQVLLMILFGLYLARQRGAALVLFASGFAGTAMEIVLLLAFQVLCGSVYHQVGVIVTVFMIGLAAGALFLNRVKFSAATRFANRRVLSRLAFAVAGYALFLPLLLPHLERAGWVGVKIVIGVLTLLLAILVGMQFPVANRLEISGPSAGASRLYTADFLGAFLGALLASTWLIPRVGVAGTCALTAALNLLAGIEFTFRKAML